MSPLLAYLDPGAGSLLLQVLVGGGAGLIVFGRYLWEAARRAIVDRWTPNSAK